jgi:hypothetical protein
MPGRQPPAAANRYTRRLPVFDPESVTPLRPLREVDPRREHGDVDIKHQTEAMATAR